MLMSPGYHLFIKEDGGDKTGGKRGKDRREESRQREKVSSNI